MSEFAAVAAIMTSLKTATDIAKALREADLSYEHAELKLQLAELVNSLADAKLQLSQVQDELTQRDQRIAELDDAFQRKDELTRVGDAYYRMDDNGAATGMPLCLRCWDVDHRQYELQYDSTDRHQRVCIACGHRVQTRFAARIDAAAADA